MQHIRDLLPGVLKKRGLHDHAEASLAVFHAQQWLAEHLPQCWDALCASALRDGTLTVTALHSVAAQECQEHAQALLEYLRQDCGHTKAERISVRRL